MIYSLKRNQPFVSPTTNDLANLGRDLKKEKQLSYQAELLKQVYHLSEIYFKNILYEKLEIQNRKLNLFKYKFT